MTQHGQLYLRDQIPPRSLYYDRGRFGRLFPWLAPFAPNSPLVRKNLCALGAAGPEVITPERPIDASTIPREGIRGELRPPVNIGDRKPLDAAWCMDPQDYLDPKDPFAERENCDHRGDREAPGKFMSAGMTFLGQFLDHDITFDTTSSLERQVDPESLANFRTPSFELDSVYGSGRAVTPHFYDQKTGGIRFLIDEDAPWDLPRNSQGTALIADPRNDENLIISQLQLAFLKFHNAVIEELKHCTDNGERFDAAQKMVRWHYQWIILHEYLPQIVGQELLDEIFGNPHGRKFFDWRHEPHIPVEFSVAAFRFGHSQVRPAYRANFGLNPATDMPFIAPIFDWRAEVVNNDVNDLRGGVRNPRRFIDWQTFFDFGDNNVRANKKIDTVLSSPLFILPFPAPGMPEDGPLSLAQRNLLRHLTFGLPSGQDVARAMRRDPLGPEHFKDAEPFGFDKSTPLWFYILREADVVGKGRILGPVGARIIAEVFIGLLEGDCKSFVRQWPEWKPEFGTKGNFKMTDLLSMAGVVRSNIPKG